MHEKTAYNFVNKYLDFPEEKATGKVLLVMCGEALVEMNWEQLELFEREVPRARYSRYKWPKMESRYVSIVGLRAKLSDTPGYLRNPVLEPIDGD